MNPIRVILAALGGFVAYFAVGAALFALVPSLINESRKYPSIFRDKDGQMSHMPVGMAATFLSILIVAVFYAQLYSGGSGLTQGAALGALIGLFVVFGFVLHNYVNLNVGLKLTLQNAAAYFLEWLITGIVIGLIYKPKA
ncbi:MAG: DUF1761 domain-containing protein [Terracidiphilus sp.]|jgi:hypothetical protein